MRILFLAHLFPLPLDSGSKIRSYHTIKTLAAEHELHLLVYVRNEQEQSLTDQMSRKCHSVHTIPFCRGRLRQVTDVVQGLAFRRSFIVSRDYRQEMQAAFDKLRKTHRPDVVHIDHLQMAQFVDWDGGYRTVLDEHNVEAMIVKRIAETSRSPLVRLYARLEWPKLQRAELDACRKADMVLTVSEEDKALLQKLDPTLANVESVPIALDVDYFQPVEREVGSKNLLSVGTMYWPPNVDAMLHFYHDIFPLVRGRVPGCTLTIAGQRPVPEIRALAADPAVTVTGYVDDVREIARSCGVFIVPLRSGSGVRVKILSAFAMGLPVVSTSVGAEGIDIEHGTHALIADTPDAFSDAVATVLGDPELARRLGENGRKLVCEKHSWEVVGERLTSLYSHKFGGSPVLPGSQ